MDENTDNGEVSNVQPSLETEPENPSLEQTSNENAEVQEGEVQPDEENNALTDGQLDSDSIVPEMAAEIIEPEPGPEPEPEELDISSISVSTEALKFLETLEKDIWRYVSFPDNMDVFVQKPREVEPGLKSVGHYCMSVEPVWFMDCDCFKISAEMNFDTLDCVSSFSLTCWLSSTLKTLQQSKKVIVQSKQHVVERKLDITLTGETLGKNTTPLTYNAVYSSCHCSQQIYQSAQHKPEVRMNELKVPAGFLSEGACIIVDRILARRLAANLLTSTSLEEFHFPVIFPSTNGVNDIFKLPVIGPPLPDFLSALSPPQVDRNIHHTLGTISYGSLPSRSMSLARAGVPSVSANVELIGFERVFRPLKSNVLPIVSFSYHMVDGHLAIHIQAGSPYQLQAVTAPLIVPEDEFIEQVTIERQELDWEADQQLQAYFGERAEELKNEYSSEFPSRDKIKWWVYIDKNTVTIEICMRGVCCGGPTRDRVQQ